MSLNLYFTHSPSISLSLSLTLSYSHLPLSLPLSLSLSFSLSLLLSRSIPLSISTPLFLFLQNRGTQKLNKRNSRKSVLSLEFQVQCNYWSRVVLKKLLIGQASGELLINLRSLKVIGGSLHQLPLKRVDTYIRFVLQFTCTYHVLLHLKNQEGLS